MSAPETPLRARVLIAEDEPLARSRLRTLLEDVDWVTEVDEAADGPAAVRAIDDLRPDLVFLDVRMPGATGLEVLDRISHDPHVVFTTAYDRYAVTAFELQALDYLLKPFGAERFGSAMERARSALLRERSERAAGSGAADESGAGGAERSRAALGAEPLRRLFVRERGRITPLAVDRIERLEARGDYVLIHAEGARHLVHVRLRDLLARLDADRFVRVHRSHVVNLDHVEAFVPWDGSRLQVHLSSGERVMASRNRSRELRDRSI
ncbi:MAG: LytTR family DNA-binding domain-containing protein [Gemmatimonadota bacterium]